jgi:predicted ATPase
MAKITGIGRPVRRVQARDDAEFAAASWPVVIPAVRQLLHDGLDLGQVTVLVGENGTGKSTILEAIAEAYGLNPEGGSTGAMHTTRRSESNLAEQLQLVRGLGAPKGGYFLRAETMHSFFTYLEENPPLNRSDLEFHARSHGESFLALIGSKFFTMSGLPRPGLFVLDEPESALSFTSSLQVLATLQELTRDERVQVLMATHSPVLAAFPGATILELTDTGFRPTTWDDLALVVNQRQFLAEPEGYLRRLRE